MNLISTNNADKDYKNIKILVDDWLEIYVPKKVTVKPCNLGQNHFTKKNFILILIPIAPDLKSEIFKKTTNKKRLILNFK